MTVDGQVSGIERSSDEEKALPLLGRADSRRFLSSHLSQLLDALGPEFDLTPSTSTMPFAVFSHEVYGFCAVAVIQGPVTYDAARASLQASNLTFNAAELILRLKRLACEALSLPSASCAAILWLPASEAVSAAPNVFVGDDVTALSATIRNTMNFLLIDDSFDFWPVPDKNDDAPHNGDYDCMYPHAAPTLLQAAGACLPQDAAAVLADAADFLAMRANRPTTDDAPAAPAREPTPFCAESIWLSAHTLADGDPDRIAQRLASTTADGWSIRDDHAWRRTGISSFAAFERQLRLLDSGAVITAVDVLMRRRDYVLAAAWSHLAACVGGSAPKARHAALLDRVCRAMRTTHPALADRIAALARAWTAIAGATCASGERTDEAVADELASRPIDLDRLPQEFAALRLAAPRNQESSAAPQAVRVLDQIGDADSTEGRSALKRYRNLLQPLPLHGTKDPDAAWAALQAEFPWMTPANREVAEAVAVSAKWSGSGFRLPPILLVGPGGVGKSRYGRRVAEICGVRFGSLSFSGASSGMLIRGSERGWSSARPCHPGLVMASEQSANPLLLIDEIDKAGESRHNGNPIEALLPLLETETSRRHFDLFLLGTLDLGHVSWMLTANDLSGLPGLLLGRVTIIHVPAPRAEHFRALLPGIVADLACDMRIPEGEFPDLDDRLDVLERGFAESLSIRSLKAAMTAEIKRRIWVPNGLRPVS